MANSTRALLLIQYGPPGLPTYYFPVEDVHMAALTPEPLSEEVPAQRFCTVRVEDAVADRAAWIYQVPPPRLETLRGFVSFDWNTMDAWYEEAEQIYVHARDPYKRVDALVSTRHNQVMLNGETIADSRQPVLLFETSLPIRYYLPESDVRMDLLDLTELTSRCPYKGQAIYYSVRTGKTVAENVVGSYPDPIAENPKIRGRLCFYNEHVDIYVDGVLQERPQTPWST